MPWRMILSRGLTGLLVIGSLVFGWWEARKRSELEVSALQCAIERADAQSANERAQELLQEQERTIRELEALLDPNDLFDRVFTPPRVLPDGGSEDR